MPNFCGKCGARIDQETGLCPQCESEKTTCIEGIVDEKCDDVTCQGVLEKELAVEETNEKTPEDVPPHHPKKRYSVITVILTVLLSVCLFFTLLCSVIIYDVRYSTKSDGIEKILENVNATDLMESVNFDFDEDAEKFYESLDKVYGIDISESQLDKFINKSTIKEFIAEELSYFCGDLLAGRNAELNISKRDVERLLQKNSTLIRDEFDVRLSNSDIEEITEWIFDSEDSKFVIATSADIKNNSSTLYNTVTMLFSVGSLIVFLVLSAIFIALMIKNSLSQAVLGTGIDLIFLGGLLSLISMLSSWITPLWNLICGNSFFGIVLGNFITANVLLSIVLLVLGIALLIIRHFVVKKFSKKELNSK